MVQRGNRLSSRQTDEVMGALYRICAYHGKTITTMLETLILDEARAVGELKPTSKRLAKGNGR